MKIDELIKELRKFEREQGNLEVGICRINSSSEDIGIDFYSDIDILKVKDRYLYSDCDSEGIVPYVSEFCGLD